MTTIDDTILQTREQHEWIDEGDGDFDAWERLAGFALPLASALEALREDITILIDDLDTGRADGTIHTYGQIQARLRDALGGDA